MDECRGKGGVGIGAVHLNLSINHNDLIDPNDSNDPNNRNTLITPVIFITL